MKNVECLLSGIKVVERKGAVVTEVSHRGLLSLFAKSFPKSRSRKFRM